MSEPAVSEQVHPFRFPNGMTVADATRAFAQQRQKIVEGAISWHPLFGLVTREYLSRLGLGQEEENWEVAVAEWVEAHRAQALEAHDAHVARQAAFMAGALP